MAASLIARVVNRATKRDAAVRAALREARGSDALWDAIRALTSEAAKLRRWRAADAALADAEMAGTLMAIAVQLHDHKPARPAGCPAVPGPGDLIAAYEAALKRAAEEAEGDG